MSTTPSEDVELLIDGKRFWAWETIDVGRHVDAFSSVEFSAPFEPESKAFRDTFRPFSFQPLELRIRGDLVFSGRLVGVEPDDDANATKVTVTGYALPGVLADCNAPASALPLQFQKVGLREIATKLLDPFGIGLSMVDDDGTSFAKVKLDVEEKLFDFLIELAQQRGQVIANTVDGDVLCWKSVEPGRPVAFLKDGEQPVTKTRAAFRPQDYFSEITGFGRKRRGKRASKYTARNDLLTGVLRPMSFRLSDVERGDATTATKAKLARMFANACAFELEVATWLDPQGDLWEPNTTVRLLAPKAFVYRESELLVRSTWLHADKESETATLGLVLPGVFSGEQPKVMPWDE